MKIKIAVLGLGLLLAASVFFLRFSKQDIVETSLPEFSPSTQDFERAASFTIFTNGTKRDFSDSRYHNQSPDVYLESTNPQIVHVKRAGTTWGDFFSTLPMKVNKECIVTGTGQTFCTSKTHTLKFYLNGTQDEDVLAKPINDNDQLLVSYGPDPDPAIEEQLKQANIMPYM